jgi:hypothetical protein
MGVLPEEIEEMCRQEEKYEADIKRECEALKRLIDKRIANVTARKRPLFSKRKDYLEFIVKDALIDLMIELRES